MPHANAAIGSAGYFERARVFNALLRLCESNYLAIAGAGGHGAPRLTEFHAGSFMAV